MGVLALAALFLAAPNATLADNECEPAGVDPSANLGVADSYDCDASNNNNDYPDGVTYTADGDLTVNFTGGGIAEVLDAGADLGGINLSATGTDSIAFDSLTVETEIESDSVTGALLNVTAVDGDIDIDTGEMDADGQTPQGVTHAIFAESTGTGSIDINTTGNVDARGTNPADSIGIQAVTGSGALTITASDGVRGNDAAIDATTGTGLLTVNIANGSGTVDTGSNGTVIRTDAGGDAIINVASGRLLSGAGGTVLDLTAVGETVVNNAGKIGNNRGGTAIRAAEGALVINNDGEITGSMDLSALNDGYTFNNNAGAIWGAGNGLNDLGAGVLNNAGTIELTGAGNVDDIGNAERITVVSAPDSTFTGLDGSVLQTTAFLNGVGQKACANVTVAGCLDLQGGTTAGQTSVLVRGNFTTLVTGPLTAVTSANPGIVLVDAGGGASEADHFVLHPDSVLVQADGDGPVATAAYAEDPVYGAVLDTSVLGAGGIFDYALLYNPDTQQHLLASVPQSEAIEYVAFIRQAASIWHTTTDTIVGRQAALRDGATGKLWARYVGDSTDYDVSPSFTTQGNTFVYDQQYSLDTKALIIGLDLISGDDRVFGVHGGLVDTRAKFETDTSDNSEGITAGLYGGWWHESGLSLDGAINLNSLTVDHTVSGSLESGDSDFRALGARIEAGWRLPLMEEALYVQPLANAAYVVADFDDVDLRDNTVSFEGTESSRVGLGARVGGAINLTDSRYQRVAYWLTARAWEEYADEGETRFATRDGGHLSITDDRSGSFEEVDFGVELTNKEGNINVHFAGGVKFSDQIDSSSHFSIGARLNW